MRESEERFRRLSDASLEGIVITDQGEIFDANKRFAQMMGYETSEALIGKSVMELMPPDERERVETYMRTGYEQTYETAALRKDETILPIEVKGSPLPYQGRNLRVTSLRDVTERKEAEAALKESEERFRLLSDASLEAITISDEGKIIDANKRFLEMFGYDSTEEIVGTSAIDVVDSEYQEMVIDYIRSDYSEPYESLCIRKDGLKFPTEVKGSPIPYQGRTLRVTSLRDISLFHRSNTSIKIGGNSSLIAIVIQQRVFG
ncbi:MAG: PAS domain S-box protein, partial [Chloroflexota bacterium]